MKIYVVTSGCYSDYGIDAVFVDKKEAAKFAAVKNKSDSYTTYRIESRIESYETADGKIDIGNNIVGFEYSAFVKDDYFMNETLYVSSDPVPKFKSEASNHLFHVWLEEENYDLAEKILRDRFAEYKAKKEGIT